MKIQLVARFVSASIYNPILFDIGPCKDTLFKTKKGEIYTLFKTKLPENHTLSGRTSPLGPYKGLPPGGKQIIQIVF